MSKFLLIFMTLTLFVIASLLPVPVSSDDNDLETAFHRDTVQLVSEECEYSPDQTWPADKIPHFIVNREGCGSDGPCGGFSCSDKSQLKAEDLNYDPIINSVGPLLSLVSTNTGERHLKIETTFIDTDVTCHDQSVVRLSQVLTPSTYYIGGGYSERIQFNVITETVMLEPLPTDTPTPIPPSIEGYVWQDVNEDGIRDDDEPGIADAHIQLFGDCGDSYSLSEMLSSVESLGAKSDSQGFYQFTNVDRLRYLSDVDRGFLIFRDRYIGGDSYIYTEANQGTDEMRDSDVTCVDDPSWPNGICITDSFARPITGTLRGIDAGIIIIPAPMPTPTLIPIPTSLISGSIEPEFTKYNPGGLVNYEIQLTNSSAITMGSAQLEAQIPAGLSLIEYSKNPWKHKTDRISRLVIGTLAATSETIFTLLLKVDIDIALNTELEMPVLTLTGTNIQPITLNQATDHTILVALTDPEPVESGIFLPIIAK